MKVAIIGAGAAGLSAGYELARRGVDVELFERDNALGGLAGSFLLDGGYVEKFYHFICLNDFIYQQTLHELGLHHRLRWRLTDMGQYYNGRIYSLGRPYDLLSFPPLPLADKIRFGLNIRKIQKADWNDWKPLEHVPIDDWLQSTFGQNVYRVLHEPMIRLKFGDYRKKISAAWIWARIHRLGRSRTKIRNREKVGYVEGGSQIIMDALGDAIRNYGGTITLNASVEKLLFDQDSIRGIVVNGMERSYDSVISTVALPAFLRLIPASLQGDYWTRLRSIESMGVVCVFLRATRSLGKFFWTNISDPRIELAGLIEYTNLNPLQHLKGDSILYLPQYIPSTDEKFSRPNQEIIREYLDYLKLIYPDFSDNQVKEVLVFREKYAQPICELGFTKFIPEIRTPLRGLYLTDSSQLHPDDRTISNSLGLGKSAASLVLSKETDVADPRVHEKMPFRS